MHGIFVVVQNNNNTREMGWYYLNHNIIVTKTYWCMKEKNTSILDISTMEVCILNSNQITYHTYNDSFAVSLYTNLLLTKYHLNKLYKPTPMGRI